MLGPCSKFVNIVTNLLPFVLVIWGFYQMCWGLTVVGDSYKLGKFLDEQTCRVAGDAFETEVNKGNCGNWDSKELYEETVVVKFDKAEEAFDKTALPYFITFMLFNFAWIFIYLYKSGIRSETYGTIGYHAQNVKSMRYSCYRNFGYLICVLLACMSLYGVTQFSSEQMGFFMNALFQIVIGLVALISPVPDTIEYGDKVKSLTVTSRPWTKSRDVMETFQDAIAAARSGQTGYLKQFTGCSESEIPEILQDVTSIPFEAGCFGSLFGGSKDDAVKDTEMN